MQHKVFHLQMEFCKHFGYQQDYSNPSLWFWYRAKDFLAQYTIWVLLMKWTIGIWNILKIIGTFTQEPITTSYCTGLNWVAPRYSVFGIQAINTNSLNYNEPLSLCETNSCTMAGFMSMMLLAAGLASLSGEWKICSYPALFESVFPVDSLGQIHVVWIVLGFKTTSFNMSLFCPSRFPPSYTHKSNGLENCAHVHTFSLETRHQHTF